MNKISIIVPVYNVERYLSECIRSVLSQSFMDFELIMINDGSTDLSGQICDEYASFDQRIKVIHKPNSGVCDARNQGLDIAQGKYVIFLDADDFWCDHFVLGRLYECAEQYNLDIVRGDYKAVDSEGRILFERIPGKCKTDLAFKVIPSGIFYTQVVCGEHFLVLSLLKKSVIGNLRFNRDRSFLEDMEFHLHLLMRPMRCMYVPRMFYSYRKLNTSASNNPKIKNLIDSFSMCDVFDELCKQTKDNELRNSYRYNSIMMYYWTLETLSTDPYYINRVRIICELSLNNRQKQVSAWAKNTDKRFPMIVHMSPGIGVLIFRYFNAFKRLLSPIKQWLIR